MERRICINQQLNHASVSTRANDYGTDSRLNTPEIYACGKKKKSPGQWSLSSCNGFRIVPNKKARVKGLWLGLALAEAHGLAAQMNYLDNASVYLLWVERQWGLDFTCLFRPWPMPPCPSRQSCCFYALVTQIMSRWTFTARKLPQRALQLRLEGWRIPGLFPFTPGSVLSS